PKVHLDQFLATPGPSGPSVQLRSLGPPLGPLGPRERGGNIILAQIVRFGTWTLGPLGPAHRSKYRSKCRPNPSWRTRLTTGFFDDVLAVFITHASRAAARGCICRMPACGLAHPAPCGRAAC